MCNKYKKSYRKCWGDEIQFIEPRGTFTSRIIKDCDIKPWSSFGGRKRIICRWSLYEKEKWYFNSGESGACGRYAEKMLRVADFMPNANILLVTFLRPKENGWRWSEKISQKEKCFLRGLNYFCSLFASVFVKKKPRMPFQQITLAYHRDK